MAVDALCGEAAFSLRKPWLRSFSLGEGVYEGRRVCAAKPLTFMNNSGSVVPLILSRFSLSLENLLVICDTMDLPPGTLRLKMRGSSGGQKGLKSIIGVLGTENFMRLYIGIGRPGMGTAGEGCPNEVISHVLGTPEGGDARAIAGAARRAAQAVLRLLVTPPEGVMNEINTR
jgi:PTH1 family peptidyl-tRNA hydrolase